jgi:peptide-methionine (S)-S-oxide reductase
LRYKWVLVPAVLVAAGLLSRLAVHAEGQTAVALPAPAVDEPAAASATSETAVLAGGCFWGIQGVFQRVNGVEQVIAGYSGGKGPAGYEQVSSGTTGHAESVQIRFDPRKISYGQILRIFFSVALNPTELNRQGPDYGTQYRSEIFYASATQRQVAESYIAQLGRAHVFDQPIVTRVDPLTGFYPAEAYHQDYLLHHPDNPYIVINDLPKVANLKRLFPAAYRDTPVTVAVTRSSM